MVNQLKRITLIVLDSVGCGDAPDAAAHGDQRANTIRNISRVLGEISSANLCQLGIGHS